MLVILMNMPNTQNVHQNKEYRTSKQIFIVIPGMFFLLLSSNPETNELLEFVQVLDEGHYIVQSIVCFHLYLTLEKLGGKVYPSLLRTWKSHSSSSCEDLIVYPGVYSKSEDSKNTSLFLYQGTFTMHKLMVKPACKAR